MLSLCASLLLGGVLQAAAPPQKGSQGDAAPATQVEKPKGDFDLPPLPAGKVSVVGGAVQRVDSVHDMIVIRAFGGRDMKVSFDTRTAIVQDNRPVRVSSLRPGTPVSIDTVVNGTTLFAKTIRVNSGTAGLEVRGQIVSYDPARSIATVRDDLSSSTMKITLSSQTTIKSTSENKATLREGELVHITLSTTGQRDLAAQSIEILAEPGRSYTFNGVLTAVDLRARTASISSAGDAGTFEVTLDRLDRESARNLREGDAVRVDAQFDGKRYNARSVEILTTSK
jgi:hypothetical protein